MLRIWGICLISIGLAAIGLFRVSEERRRLTQFKSVIVFLAQLERELQFRQADLKTIFLGLEHPLASYCAQALSQPTPASMQTIWHEGLATLRPPLGEEATRRAGDIGNVLGRYDAASQCQALANTRGILEVLADEEREKLARTGKLYTTLSVAAGAFVFLILI